MILFAFKNLIKTLKLLQDIASNSTARLEAIHIQTLSKFLASLFLRAATAHCVTIKTTDATAKETKPLLMLYNM